MGKLDEYHFDYLDDNSRFADQINGALSRGRQIVRQEELEPAEVMENEEKKYDMCKAFVDMKLEGVMEGQINYLIKPVCKKLQKNKPAAVIADELEEELVEIERVIAAQQQVGSYDAEQIYKVYSAGGC